MHDLLMPLEGDHEGEIFEELSVGSVTVRNADYTDCTFRRCRFEATRFEDCRFTDCVFDEATLVGVRFPMSSFSATTFRGGRVMGASFVDVQALMFDVTFERVRLDLTNFDGLPLRDTRFLACSMKEVRLAGTDLRAASFNGSDLTGAILEDANLTETDFSGTQATRLPVGRCRLEKTVVEPATALLALHDMGLRCPDLEAMLGYEED